MKNSIKIAVVSYAALLWGLVACNNADYDTFGTHAYVSESAAGKKTKVTITDDGAVTEITACLSSAAPHDVKLKFVLDTMVLKRYNKTQSSSYVPLPATNFEVEGEIVIKKGEYSAPATKVRFKPLSQEQLGESYALPLQLVCEDGTIPTTAVTSSCVIVTDVLIISSMPMFNGGAGLNADKFPVSLPQFTVETRFQLSNTDNRNRAVFSNGNGVLLRFEDPQSDNPEHKKHSLVQFQGSGWYLNPSKSFEPNKWQHLALTYDGSAVTIYVNGAFAGTKTGVNAPEFKSASWFGGGDGGEHGIDDSWWKGCKILCSELRVWSVCRTEAQIQNNMITVGSKSEGLEAYWRMNEGTGNTFEDYTGKGHTLRTTKMPTWVPGIKSTDTETKWP